MANDLESNYKLFEALGMVLLSRVEAELVSLTYEATRMLKQGLQAGQGLQDQSWFQHNELEQFVRHYTANGANSWPKESPTDDTSLHRKIAQLTAQLDQRDQAISTLTARIERLEAYLAQQSGGSESTSQPEMSALASRLTAIEESLNSIDLLATELGHRGATTAALDSRVTKLEAAVQETAAQPEPNPSITPNSFMPVVEGDRTL